MTGLFGPRIHPPCVLIECWTRGMKKGKMLGASYRHNFPQDRFARNSKLWHYHSLSGEETLPKIRGGRMVNGRACRKKLVKKKAKGRFRFSL